MEKTKQFTTIPLGSQLIDQPLQGGNELDGAHEQQPLLFGEVEFHRFDEMNGVDLDVDENVQHLNAFGLIDGHQATVAVVHQQIDAQGFGGVIVDATRAVRDVAHDDRVRVGEPFDDVAQLHREHGQAFGHLERDAFGLHLPQPPYGLGQFEIVIRRQRLYGSDQVRIFGNLVGYSVQNFGRRSEHLAFGVGLYDNRVRHVDRVPLTTLRNDDKPPTRKCIYVQK